MVEESVDWNQPCSLYVRDPADRSVPARTGWPPAPGKKSEADSRLGRIRIDVSNLAMRFDHVMVIDIRRNEGYWDPGDPDDWLNFPSRCDINPRVGVDHGVFLASLAELIASLIARGYSACPCCDEDDEQELCKLVRWG